MRFDPPLIEGRLIRRYKRFLADVELGSGETITAHCANPGAMEGLMAPGLTVWLSKSDAPQRKLAYSWELAQIDSLPGATPVFVGINTARPNRLVEEALIANRLDEFAGYTSIRREVGYGTRSRVDFLLSAAGARDCYLEVKNAHLLRQPGLAEFPDSRTERGARHLNELARMREAGQRAVTLFVVQRSDAERFSIAADKDPAYAKAYGEARRQSVEMLVRICNLSPQGIELGAALPLVDRPCE